MQDYNNNDRPFPEDPGATVYEPAEDTQDPGATVYEPVEDTQDPGETVYEPAGDTQDPGETEFVPAAAENGSAGGAFNASGRAAAFDAATVPAGTVIDGYMIVDVLSDQGKESVVYLARNSGRQYALKLFKRKVEISKAKLDALKGIDCPYVTVLRDYGLYNGMLYEVYDYYKNGTIETIGKVDTNRLTEFVNQLNEGLHKLHTLGGWNMIHGDLKPANIFLSDDGTRLLIGDFGISAVLNGQDYSLGNVCGTPEYAPPTLGVVNRAKRTPAFDYGSLGLVIYFLATGRSYFKGMRSEAIAESWVKGITIPTELDTRIKMLLSGLLVSDERYRSGYMEVKNWYKGSFVQAATDRSVFSDRPTVAEARLWFGIFDGRSVEVSSIPELVQQMKTHWKQACIKLTDTNLYKFLDNVTGDSSTGEKVRKIVAENPIDAAVFKVIYLLSKNSDIVYKGVNYGPAGDFVAKASVSDDPDIREVLLSGLFRYYLVQLGYPDDMIQALDEIMELKDVPESFKMRVFNYVFSPRKEYMGCSNIDELRTMAAHGTLASLDQITSDEAFFAWLYSQGMGSLALTMLRTLEVDS